MIKIPVLLTILDSNVCGFKILGGCLHNVNSAVEIAIMINGPNVFINMAMCVNGKVNVLLIMKPMSHCTDGIVAW